MNKNNKVVASTADTSTLVRAKFGAGMLLQHEDLEQLNVYTRELSRLLFKSFFGCGVVCGLAVKAEFDNCNKVFVTVGSGLALDCSGDPVYVQRDKRFALDENCDPDISGPLWVVLCSSTKNCAPRTSMCADDDDKATSLCTRERDMFEIRVVRERPKCVCGCDEPSGPPPAAMERDQSQQGSEDDCLCADPACHADHYAGKCGCDCVDGSNCGGECILLARLDKVNSDGETQWIADHRVRRFIRPVLMRDPEARKEVEPSNHHAREREETIRMEMRREQSIRDAEFEIQQLQGQVSDSVMQAQKLSEELKYARQLVSELQRQNADLERANPRPAASREPKGQPVGIKKASKKPEEKA